MTRILLNGHPTWVQLPKKTGATILLLHGGLSSSASLLRVLGPSLAKNFQLAAFDRRGHGRTADRDEEFDYGDMADEAIAYVEHVGRRVHLLGHSDGANVALKMVLRRPDLVRRAVLVGANYHHNGLVPMEDFTPESPDFNAFAHDFARRSPDGLSHAAVVVRKSLALVKSQPTLSRSDLSTITVPVLIMSGDDDVVRLSHVVSMYEAIPQAQLAVVPGTSHAVLKERTKECRRMIEDFLLGDVPPNTKYPLRRARPATTA